MTTPARNTLAVIGAGPIGLEAASVALDHGFDVHVFERGEVGSHALAWGHVRMFTPWRMNVGPSTARRLAATAWATPDGEECPTGRELAERVLAPLAKVPELASRIHAHAQVVHVSRQGALKSDGGARAEHPFRLLVRDQGGRESFLHAFAVIDASGVYGQPNWAGDGGIPARNEIALAPQMAYHVDDVLDLMRERYAGKRTLVIGGGASAATVVSDLVTLATTAPGTTVAWATRRPSDDLFPETDDPLAERRRLHERARGLAGGGDPVVTPIGGVAVEGFEFNSATHRTRVTLLGGPAGRVEEVDRVIVCCGFGPDNTIYRELQVDECYATRGPMKLAAALRGSGASDCLDTPAFGVDVLSHPEPHFYILGHKSYGSGSNFLLETGYRQVADVVAHLAKGLPAPASA